MGPPQALILPACGQPRSGGSRRRGRTPNPPPTPTRDGEQGGPHKGQGRGGPQFPHAPSGPGRSRPAPVGQEVRGPVVPAKKGWRAPGSEVQVKVRVPLAREECANGARQSGMQGARQGAWEGEPGREVVPTSSSLLAAAQDRRGTRPEGGMPELTSHFPALTTGTVASCDREGAGSGYPGLRCPPPKHTHSNCQLRSNRILPTPQISVANGSVTATSCSPHIFLTVANRFYRRLPHYPVAL